MDGRQPGEAGYPGPMTTDHGIAPLPDDEFSALFGRAAAAGYRTVGIFDANGEADQQGLRNAAEVYLTSLARLPAHWERLNNEN